MDLNKNSTIEYIEKYLTIGIAKAKNLGEIINLLNSIQCYHNSDINWIYDSVQKIKKIKNGLLEKEFVGCFATATFTSESFGLKKKVLELIDIESKVFLGYVNKNSTIEDIEKCVTKSIDKASDFYKVIDTLNSICACGVMSVDSVNNTINMIKDIQAHLKNYNFVNAAIIADNVVKYCGIKSKVLSLIAECVNNNIADLNIYNTKQNSWHTKHYNIAKAISQHSKDSKKVGCVVVNDVNNILATGYNGFPRGFNDNIPERHERPTKYNYTIHAEANAIAAAALNGSSLRAR